MSLTCIDWFAGIGGMRLAFTRAGWQCVWACERDPDARAVYAAHFGAAPDAADLLDVAARDIPAAACWVGGFPCQDLSVAGGRRGFDGTRSVLVFRLLALAAVLRPPWLVLENVPGLLSVRGGSDFGALLCAVEDAGYVGAWRVLDARWFGVPQRRRRVFVVARRAGARGVHPAEVLLEPARVRRGDPAGGTAGEDFTRPLGCGSAGGGAGERIDLDHGALVAAPVTAREQKGPDSDCTSGQLVIADPISCTEGKTYSHEGAHNFRLRNVVAFDLVQATHPENRSRWDADGIAPPRPATPSSTWPTPPVDSSLGTGVSLVRRLTPRECERLQGFPDDWTRAVPLRDSVRYRLIGNSVAVPCVQWVAQRLAGKTRL